MGGDITLPVTFLVENHPLIRARILTEQQPTAVEIAQVLKGEFALSAQDAAQLLADEGDAADAVGQASSTVFDQSAAEAALILHRPDYTLAEIFATLKNVFIQAADDVVYICGADFGVELARSSRVPSSVRCRGLGWLRVRGPTRSSVGMGPQVRRA